MVVILLINTYVKQIKKNNKIKYNNHKLSNEQSNIALNKTISFVNERYNYNIDIHKKIRLIEDRLLLIKFSKK